MQSGLAVFPPGKQAKFEGLGYSPAVACGPFLHVAGQVGVGESGVVAEPEAQFRLAFEKVFALCREAGFCAPGDIVEVKTFQVDMDKHEAAFFKVKKEFFPSPPYPAFTGLIEVKKLGMDGLLLEVAATAYRAR